MKKFIAVTLLLTIKTFCFSQNNNPRLLNITGRVFSCDSQPINGVSIFIKGSRYGATLSSGDGKYKMTNIKDGDTVIFTHVAYYRTAVKIKGNNLLNVIMEKSIKTLPSFKIIDSVNKKNNMLPLKNNNENRIFNRVEIEPSFPGGDKALFKYLDSAVTYPEEARNKNIEGEVLVSFTVGLKGEIKNALVVHGISKECDEVALKAVRGMPNWKYGIQNGRFAEGYIELPITFSLIEKNR